MLTKGQVTFKMVRQHYSDNTCNLTEIPLWNA